MEPRAYFGKTREAYALASERTDSASFRLQLARREVDLTFASTSMSDRLTRALVHRMSETNGIKPSISILAWDTVSTGVPAPSPPWGTRDYRGRGDILGFNRDGIHTAFHLGANVLSLFDELTDTALFWTPDASSLPDYQIGSPFLHVLHWWAERQGLSLIHAGAVGVDDAGVLLAGAGGSGKSTTALVCAAASDLRYVSDDYCLFESASGDRAYSIFDTGKLDPYSLSLLPQFRSMAADWLTTDDGKSIVFLQEHMPEVLVDSLSIRAILLPNPAGLETTGLRPASPAEGLRALAPSTIFQLSGAGSRAFTELGSLVRRIPCFHLDLSSHMRDVPDTVKSILDQTA